MKDVVLGIETSCDDTSCALFSRQAGVIVHRTAAQLAHVKYGGVVPEIASRSHMRTLLPLYETVMEEGGISLGDLAGIGVTNGPGLTGSLLVGLSFAKALSYASGLPLSGVHHIEGHIMANDIEQPLKTPCVALVVSGGHTQLFKVEEIGRYELLGGTRDDAAGEAFDKIGKLLGLPYPGGPEVEKLSKGGDREAFDFPRGLKNSGECDFSFSGLKTAVRLKIESSPDARPEDIAASAQEAIADILAAKSVMAADRTGIDRFYMAGGVAANGRVRELLVERMAPLGIEVKWPPVKFCTDNAVMIACAAAHRIAAGKTDGLELNTFARGALSSWK